LGGEAQIGRTDLHHFAARPHTGNLKRRISPSCDYNVSIRRQALEQKGYSRLDLCSFGEVVVVQHKVDCTFEGRELVHDRRKNQIARVLCRLQDLQRDLAEC
jgi:hypothetical protein